MGEALPDHYDLGGNRVIVFRGSQTIEISHARLSRMRHQNRWIGWPDTGILAADISVIGGCRLRFELAARFHVVVKRFQSPNNTRQICTNVCGETQRPTGRPGEDRRALLRLRLLSPYLSRSRAGRIDQTLSTSFPLVPRPSRSRWACAASMSG